MKKFLIFLFLLTFQENKTEIGSNIETFPVLLTTHQFISLRFRNTTMSSCGNFFVLTRYHKDPSVLVCTFPDNQQSTCSADSLYPIIKIIFDIKDKTELEIKLLEFSTQSEKFNYLGHLLRQIWITAGTSNQNKAAFENFFSKSFELDQSFFVDSFHITN